MIILHEHPLSPYAQKVKIALREKDIAFESRFPNLIVGDAGGVDAHNPRVEVPTLVDGDTPVFDSTIILEYIEDRWPTPPLLPATPAERARARTIEDLCDTYYEAIVWGTTEILFFERATGDLRASLMARAAEQIAGVNAYLSRQLGDRPYFQGDSFGWADLSVVPHVNAASLGGNTPAPGSNLAAWFERVRVRPSVKATFDAAGAALAAIPPGMLPKIIASGQLKRQYRDHRLEWMLRSGGLPIVLEGMEKDTIKFGSEIR